MAKRNKPAVPPAVNVEATEIEGVEPSPAEAEEADKLAEFQSEFEGKDYKVRVERFNKEESCWEIVARVPLAGWDSYTVLRSFGGGRFRCTLLNEQGKYVAGGRQEIRMAIVAKDEAPAAPAAAPAPVEQDPLKHPLVMTVLAMMEKSNIQTVEILKAMAARPEPQRSSSSEVIEMMEKVRRMAPEDPMKDITKTLLLSVLQKGLEGGDGGGEGGGSFIKDLREGLALLRETPLLNARRRPPEAAAPDAGAAAALEGPVKVNLPGDPQHSSTAPQPAPKEPATVSNPIIEGLRPHAQVLRQKAENGADINETADYLINELYDTAVPLIRRHVAMAKFASDDAIVEQIMNRAQDPAQVEVVFQYVPELAAHRDWCLGVIRQAVVKLNEPDPGQN